MFFRKQITGIEPASPAWEASILPMNYICMDYSLAHFSPILKSFLFDFIIFLSTKSVFSFFLVHILKEKRIFAMQIHVVTAGETVNSIAEAYQIPADTIIYNNQLIFPYTLAIGQALLLSVSIETTITPTVVNGYAYPFINNWVLDQTLPYLSRLSVFSYGFTTEGFLIPPIIDDDYMIAQALERRVAPFLTLTPFDASGQFNNFLISSIVNNASARSQLISDLESTVIEKGFQGVDIDFEFILAEDRIGFANFVAEVRTAINALGYPVTVALAPKTSDDQPGLLYEGKDYALLGEAADEVLLMTYEWGYTFEHKCLRSF